MVKKPSNRQKRALADPTTQAAMDGAMKEADDLFGPKIDAVLAEMKAFAAGRNPRNLTGADAVTFMALKARFDALAIEHQHFAEAAVRTRLNPDEGSETVDA